MRGQKFFGAAAVLLAGCARVLVPLYPPLPINASATSVCRLGKSCGPFTGIPWYFQTPVASGPPAPVQPGIDERLPVVGHRDLPIGERRERLRALLAAADAHVVALDGRPSFAEQTALELTADEIAQLMEPWPDIAYEADELAQLVRRLPSTTPLRLPETRERMGELIDLIRLQLMAGS